MTAITQFVLLVLLLAIGYAFGRMAEKKHYKRIINEEKEMNVLPAISTRLPPENKIYEQQLVLGSVVVANDYFKFFTASLKSLFGGRLNTYESLLDRGRREAVLRMKRQAQSLNAELVFNVKYVTTNLNGGQKGAMGVLEIFAYGTALTPSHK